MGTRTKLIAARKAHDLSQGELAARVGVVQSTISKLEAGDHVPLGDTLAKICTTLGISPADLLAIEEEPGHTANDFKRAAGGR